MYNTCSSNVHPVPLITPAESEWACRCDLSAVSLEVSFSNAKEVALFTRHVHRKSEAGAGVALTKCWCRFKPLKVTMS